MNCSWKDQTVREREPVDFQVFIPVVNEVAHLDVLLESLSNVMSLGVEVIVLVNSTNFEIFSSSQQRYPAVRFEFCAGGLPADENWQRCLDFLSSRWFKIVCADDVLDSEALTAELNWILADKGFAGISIIAGRRETLLDGRKRLRLPPLRWRPKRMNGGLAFFLQSLLLRNFIGEPLVVWFNADLFSRSAGFRYPLPCNGVPYLLDLNAYQRMLQLGDIRFSGMTVGRFRIHAKSTSVELGRGQMEQVRAFNQHRYQNREIGRIVLSLSLTSAALQILIRNLFYLLIKTIDVE